MVSSPDLNRADSGAEPCLSVIVPTLRGWPAIADCLDALLPQVRAVHAELVVADASGSRPTLNEPCLRWNVYPGLGIFDLRLKATACARGPVVAVTEDHCLVGPGWCEAIVKAHERWPSVDAVKGLVTNGSTRTIVDWAAFLINQIAHVAPLDQGRYARLCGIANTSYKTSWFVRSASSSSDTPRPSPSVAYDAAVQVAHVQSERWRVMAGLQYHNARAVTGLAAVASGRCLTGLLAAPLMPWARLVRLLAAYRHKDVSQVIVWKSVPWMIVLLHAKSAGEAVGALAGPGRSASRIQ